MLYGFLFFVEYREYTVVRLLPKFIKTTGTGIDNHRFIPRFFISRFWLLTYYYLDTQTLSYFFIDK